MTDISAPSEGPRPPRHLSRLSMALLVMTTLAALMALALMWATQWAVVHTATGANASVNDANRAAFATPIFWAGVAMIALIWIALWRWLHLRYPAIPITLALIAASLAAIFFWRSQTVGQSITISAYSCAAGTDPFTDNTNLILTHCVPDPDGASATFGPADNPAAFDPDGSEGSLTNIPGLPIGTYGGYLTTTAPLETASLVLAVETPDGIQPLRQLQPNSPFGGPSGTWSAPITIQPGTRSFLLLTYLSEKPALPNARVTFNVEQCTATSPTAFDPAGCQPMAVEDWILQEFPGGSGPTTFRQPIRTREGSTVTYSNLEEQPYRFTPMIGNAAITASDYGFLVMPSAGPQTAQASILKLSPETQREEFSIDVSPDTGALSYTIYIFPTHNVYAGVLAPNPHIADLNGGLSVS